MTKVLTCPKCNSTMETGFTLDVTHGNFKPSEWVEGTPKNSFWTGVRVDVKLEIATYRCTGCGYLESYAM